MTFDLLGTLTGKPVSTQITLTLSDQLYESAMQWSHLTHRDLIQTLTEALASVLMPVYTMPELEQPISSLTDANVLILTKLRMDAKQGERLSKLVEQQRTRALSPSEQAELVALMQIYNKLWIRQSEALAEAVHRGLRSPLVG